jgi:Family of unknown function (DUF6262)
MTDDDRAARLAEHARARHEQTLQRAQAALKAMAREGDPVTVARLAAEASVSRAWIYTQPGLRDQVKQMQRGRLPGASPPRQADSRASDESLRRRLELAHQKITQLRAENQQLRRDLAAAHGQLRAAAASREGDRW